ncbi:hypothetical protein AAFM71_07435 [Chromobacterium violaceum]|uniref:hypothetical protein n=1 Tax=Chromobacterium violaceum TaxID=536 RepID=UPI0038580EDD
MFITLERWEYSPYTKTQNDTLLREDLQPSIVSLNAQHIVSHQKILAHLMVGGIVDTERAPKPAVLVHMSNGDIHVALDDRGAGRTFREALDIVASGRNVDLGESQFTAARANALA